MTIKALDDLLINKIAAGEVIERPASVVKELIENSIDAGAAVIAVNISGGGTVRIEVEDDGEGLDYDDIPLAFQRHATSKIKSAEDLFDISTMGFRGEALPSIASVARIELYSKKPDANGVLARLEGGKFLKLEAASCPEGTRIIVEDLFFNTPARRSFMKSPVSEGGHIYDLMCRYALARPEISFSFSNENKSYFKTPGNGNLKDAVICIYGRDMARYLVEASYTGDAYRVAGLISTPELHRLNRKNQLFFINHRPVRSLMLFKAIDQAYQGRLLAREHPVVILSITVPRDQVDVNVHPQKNEVRFKDEKTVFRIVHEVIKDSLEPQYYRPLNYYRDEDRQWPRHEMPPAPSEQLQETVLDYDYLAEPADTYNNTPASIALNAPLKEVPATDAKEYRIIGQCLQSYILVETAGSLYLVDQHAAHERILYNHLKASFACGEEISQTLALPLPIELSTRQVNIITENSDYFAELGFSLDAVSPDTILVRAAPAYAVGQELDLINELLELRQDKTIPDLKDESIKTMACKKAVKAGDGLFPGEMERIIKDLFSTSDYKHCPHGRPTIIKMSRTELDRMFKR